MNHALTPVPLCRAESKHRIENRTFQGIPGVEVSAKGRLFAVWYAGGEDEGKENYVLLAVSDDRGAHWTDAFWVVDPPHRDVRAFDAVLWRSPEERIFLFWAQAECPAKKQTYDGVAGVWYSVMENPDDPPEQIRWTFPQRIADGIMMNKPTVLRNGVWALPISVWDREMYLTQNGRIPPVFQKGRLPEAGAKMYLSSDSGRTFYLQGETRVLKNGQYDEHVFLECRDGSIRCYLRTLCGVAESVSTDGGRTWTPPKPSKIRGTCSRFALRRLKSGRVLLIFHQPEGGRNQIIAWLSEDDGANWLGGLVLDERPLVSYPDIAEAENGMIYVIYDHERYLEGDIFIVSFREENVLAKSCRQTDDFPSRHLVSHTGGVPESAGQKRF